MYTPRKFTPEARLAIAVLRDSISPGGDAAGTAVFAAVDWEKFKSLAVTHEIVPFLYPFLKSNHTFVPLETLSFFKDTYYCTFMRCRSMEAEFLRILQVFEEAGIGLVPLKGVAFLQDMYASSPVRTMTDIDVLVKDSQVVEACRVLACTGYRQDLEGLNEEYWSDKHYHMVFRRDGKTNQPLLELHRGVDYKRCGRDILTRMWERLNTVSAGGRDIRLLSAEDTFFCLALHLRRFGKVQCLKNIFDAAMLLEKHRDTFDWDYVIKEAREGKMKTTAYFLLRQTGYFLSIDLPHEVERSLKVSRYKKMLIDRLIARSLFADFSYTRERCVFLKSQFLLYDGLAEPVRYVLSVPSEQFCKYYGLTPYTPASERLYKLRILYALYRLVRAFFEKISAVMLKENKRGRIIFIL